MPGVRQRGEAAALQHSPAQLCPQPSSGEAALLKMACSICSCGASHRRFSTASVREPCWGGGAKGSVEEPHTGQAAAPCWKHRSASGSPCLCEGEQGPGAGEMGKAPSACTGEEVSKERCLKGLCLSWGSLCQAEERTLSTFCPLLLVARCLGPRADSRGREMWTGSPAPLPVAACASSVTPGTMLPPGQTWPASRVWGLRLLCKRATQLAG